MPDLLLALHAGHVVWRPTTYVCMYVCTIARVVIAHPYLLVWTTSERLLSTLVASGGSHPIKIVVLKVTNIHVNICKQTNKEATCLYLKSHMCFARDHEY